MVTDCYQSYADCKYSYRQADFDTFIYSHSVISVVSELDRIAPVVLIMAASSDLMQDELLAKVLSSMPKLPPHRCLFFETSVGKVSMIRQLNPSLHVENDLVAYEQMQSFLKRMVLVGDRRFNDESSQHSSTKRFHSVDSMADTLTVDWSIAN